ncbi:hypothetical protein AVV30_gp055 [Vibrio phage phi 1]|uniref:Uncharacterized protein n=1 Tax=Vibrio phage phi 1 TaxID=1589297 RepID=A0A0B5H8K3_9CAUD|nr:hypothetical protein AVV30_gp055 [Vibrio phage phi 1]AJF40713.1 hypothetical protein SBVP1_0055 [Vibrio phage phi 1]
MQLIKTCTENTNAKSDLYFFKLTEETQYLLHLRWKKISKIDYMVALNQHKGLKKLDEITSYLLS